MNVSMVDTAAVGEPLTDVERLVDRKIVLCYYVAAMTYMVVSMLGGLLVALQLIRCNDLQGIELLSPGRWRMVHTNAIAYGFLANGSNTVIASLWPVEDALPARFMKEFYGAYRSSGRVADALRTAQLRTRDTAGPTVWSSFVVRASTLQ